MDVHDALKEYFENGRDGLCKNEQEKKTNKFKFFKNLTHENPIRQTEETFNGLEKINPCYQFIVTNVGLVYSKK